MVKKQKKSGRTRTRTIVKIVHDKTPAAPDPLGGMGSVIGAGVGLMSLGVIGSMGVGITSQIAGMTHVSAHKISKLRKYQLEAIKKIVIIPSQTRNPIYVQIDDFGKWIAREHSPARFEQRYPIIFKSPHEAINYYKNKYGAINVYSHKRI